MKYYFINRYFVFIMFTVFWGEAYASDLVLGFNRSERLSEFQIIKKSLGYRPYSLVEGEHDNIFWGMSGDGKGVAKYHLNDSMSVEGWALSRWPQELKSKNVASMYRLASEPEFARDYAYKPANSNPLSVGYSVLGCLAHHPLRYGDFDDNGTSELVLFLGYESEVLDIVMFSPEYEKIQFSVRSIFTDATDFDYGDSFKYQFASNFNMNKGWYVGTKTYAKIFVGEFDGNKDSPDIIVWRKRYQSLPKGSVEKGFQLVYQNYQLYTLAGDEYQLQVSLEAQIERLMKDNNLTWSKGFPSISECPGEEGKLIPEMHDPLLNDPDVLK
ncbi:hypothetical protein [Thalassolituus hydrocarboniclasticus]|uniref:Tle cognate immunity protein 4 C-terminal domain-containing protein n=1 Tax=Thalassolituus hydrocarboniclasticus TaxID=2742796 RepID=A0ABY6A7H3_9GAMM|nr:hypothetical protein [Thalassolituus hydrocarboniclasticus]UXD86201.1 hypothetical protein HUF19_01500 [Thalassolituus hydrocarboniclasticus]